MTVKKRDLERKPKTQTKKDYEVLEKLVIEPKTQTKKDYEVLEKLEDYINSSTWPANVKLANFTKYVRSHDLGKFFGRYEIFKKITKVQGAIIECGVLYGGGLMGWAHFCSLFEPINHSRKIIGFDTFTGYPGMSKVDKKGHSNYAKKGGMASYAFEDLKKCIDIFDHYRYIGHIPKIELVKGDVVKTIPKYVKTNQHLVVSLLYLDMNLYEPTKIALKYLVPRMPKGAVIVFDELYSRTWQGVTQALVETLGISNLKIEKFNFNNYQSYAVIE